METITPSRKLQYTPCYDGYECARLEVPLDWNATIDDDFSAPAVALAIARKPAAVDITDPRYGGVVLLNPGGPGGSGINLLLKDGASLQTIVSSGHSPRNASENVTFYDVLSWDPRGVNNTTPGHICIQDRQARIAWDSQDVTLGHDLEDPSIFAQHWARSTLFGENCASVNGTNDLGTSGLLGEFTGTASVVRDMVEIIERHGEWREATAQKLLLDDTTSLRRRDSQALARTAWNIGAEQLQYWGFSYGSLLGQYFANMQPERVRRMVLDGVANADDYAAGEWAQNLHDTNALLLEFATQCFAARSLCPTFDDHGPAQIVANIHTTVAALKSDPLAGRDGDKSPFIVSASLLTDTIFAQLYSPFFGFSETARLLAAATAGNASYFIPYLPATPYAPEALFPSASRPTIGESFTGIACTDGLPHLTETKSASKSYVSNLTAQSPLFGSGWSLLRTPCRGYSVRPRWRFPGPFGALTAHPILFASQARDPVTPLRHAEAATKRYPGSGLLNAGGAGHCTTSGVSMCAMKAVRNHFQTGRMPEAGLVCGSEVDFFAEGGPRARFEWAEESDGALWEAMLHLADNRPGSAGKHGARGRGVWS
ncbi:MAG: hypothetical protein ASARMPRED_008168 [Alectoria sarmentosa]|nr:MAG: hypothetical protein ASARMPRED_008168 [Alectoria sarmentosa]